MTFVKIRNKALTEKAMLGFASESLILLFHFYTFKVVLPYEVLSAYPLVNAELIVV